MTDAQQTMKLTARAERGMWPFSEMSLEAASLWGDIANWTLIVCLIGGVLATLGIVQTTNVKERHWDTAREKSGERIKELETESLRAKADLEAARADIAQANAASAAANARAEEAKLELAKFRQPRVLSPDAQKRITAAMRSFPDTSFNVAVSNSQEPVNLLRQIEDSLSAASWKQVAWPAGTILRRNDRPGAGIATESAVTIQVEDSEKEGMLAAAKSACGCSERVGNRGRSAANASQQPIYYGTKDHSHRCRRKASVMDSLHGNGKAYSEKAGRR